jgi:ATP-dependent DNA helicase RecQ
VRDEVDVIVATIAFGMGIDKSNVRFVIHGDLPKSLEAYYQETGRAGRDGLLSHCLLLYSSQDIRTLRYFIEQSEDMEERRRGERNLKTILRYAESEQCRRSVLLGHFGEEYSGNCNHCDICTDAARVEDCTLDAQKLLSAVARTGESFGAGHIVDIVKGADTRRIRERGHHTLPTYGVGSEKAKEYWRELLEELQRRELLRPEGERYPVLQMTPGGRDVLFGRSPFQRTLRRRRTELLKKGNAGKGGGRAAHSRSATASAAGAGERSESGAQHLREELFQRLRDWRRQEAQRRRIAPYMVFSDATLRQLAADQPLSREELLRVEGVGRAKMKRYGRSLIELIAAFQVERQG